MENIFLTTFATLSIFLSSGIPNTIPAQNQKAEIKTVNKENKANLKVITQKKKITQPLAVNIDRAKAVQPIIVQPSGNGPINDAQIQFLGNCESGMTASRNSGNGYFGAFQFSIGTWNSMNTVYARADLAPLDVQIDAVRRLLSRSSIWRQFPACSRRMQTAGII